jgi:hypothetical protein
MFGRELGRNFEVGDFQVMLDERSAGFSVLSAPFDMRQIDPAMRAQKPCAVIGERTDDRRGEFAACIKELVRAADISLGLLHRRHVQEHQRRGK